MDDLHYLEPGFDATSLTIPQLRKVLLAHDIEWPSSAKKPLLVDLFNAHIPPLARKLLADRARVRRRASDIENITSSRGYDVEDDNDNDDDDDREATPVPGIRASRQSTASRRSSRAPTAESEAPSIAQSVASRRSTRYSSAAISEADDSQAETPRAAASRRSRKSIHTPAPVKEESPIPDDDDSPFTSENIFQQGSSPQPDTQRRRRTTAGSAIASEKKRSSTSRRRTEMTPVSRKSMSFQVPVAYGDDDEDDDEEIEAGEEFVPEEEMVLAAEAERNGGKDVLPARRRRAKTSGNVFKSLLAIVGVMSSGVFYKWREEKLAVGYCGIGRPSTSIGGVQVPNWAPEWADSILPTCEPCPQHAYCHPDLRTTCEPDFILKDHPLALFGTVPLPPTCEPDGQKVRKIKTVADRAVEVLRERNAQFECGELKASPGKKVEAPLPEPELKATISAKRSRSMSEEEFEDIWQSVLPELRNRDEISSGVDGSGYTNFRSNSHARMSIGCSLRRSIRATLAQYLRYIVMLVFIVGIVAYARRSFRSARALEAKGKQLAGFALDRLATQAALHADGRAPEPFIAINQLRDDVLRDEFSRKSREAVWERVRDKVEGNANVRSSMKETRTGDMARVWEWIGAIDALDDESSPWASGLSRRKSGRYSVGPGAVTGSIEDTPSAQLLGRDRSASPRKSEVHERKVWENSRPIY